MRSLAVALLFTFPWWESVVWGVLVPVSALLVTQGQGRATPHPVTQAGVLSLQACSLEPPAAPPQPVDDQAELRPLDQRGSDREGLIVFIDFMRFIQE